jgi:hypothetical protein
MTLTSGFDIARLLESLPSADSGGQKPAGGTSDEVGGESTPAETEIMEVTRMELDAAAEEEMEVVISCLEEIAKVLSNPDQIMVSVLGCLLLIYPEKRFHCYQTRVIRVFICCATVILFRNSTNLNAYMNIAESVNK